MRPTPRPSSRRSLLGADFEEVRRLYGAPLAARAGGGILEFAYADIRGEVIEDAVVVADGVVVSIAEGLRRGQEADQSFVGARVEDLHLHLQLGAAHGRDLGGGLSDLHFTQMILTACEGLVVSVRVVAPVTAAS